MDCDQSLLDMICQHPRTVPSVDLEHEGNPNFVFVYLFLNHFRKLNRRKILFEVSIGGTLFGI